MKNYIVLKPLVVGYDSHCHRPTSPRYKKHMPGTVLAHQSDAPNGNVWFIDPDGERGKTESGEVANLVRSQMITEL